MSNIENIKNVEKNFDEQMQLSKIREEVLKRYDEYRKTISFLATDAPIGILCLPKTIETILICNKFLRVYDLLNMDFTKVKGLGVRRCRNLASSLEQFIAML